MAEYVAGSGTTALGIIGTILGGVALAGGSKLINGLGGSDNYVTKEMFEHNNADLQALAEKDAEIANLKSDQAMNDKVLDLYKYVETQFKSIREDENTKWTSQAVINSQLNSSVNVLSSQLNDTATTLNNLTKVVIPSSNVCTSSGCSGNI